MARVQDRLETMPLAELMAEAAALRDAGHGRVMSYSRKVFIPLTVIYLIIVAVWMQTPWNIWK